MRATDCTLGWRWADGRLTIQTPSGTLNLTPLADDLIHFQVRAIGGALVLPTGGVVKHDWAPVQAAVTEQEGELVLTTPRMRVEITLQPVTLTWYEGDRVIARGRRL